MLFFVELLGEEIRKNLFNCTQPFINVSSSGHCEIFKYFSFLLSHRVCFIVYATFITFIKSCCNVNLIKNFFK